MLYRDCSFSLQNTTTCEPLLWKSCTVKTPFCGNAFRATCNCVVLNVRKHNWTDVAEGNRADECIKSDAN